MSETAQFFLPEGLSTLIMEYAFFSLLFDHYYEAIEILIQNSQLIFQENCHNMFMYACKAIISRNPSGYGTAFNALTLLSAISIGH